MSLQYAVLGVLEARPMSGYELTQFFESTARWVWTAPQSQIYPLLTRMASDGLITGEEQVRGSKLKRTSYSITDSGVLELRHWLAEPHAEPNVRDAFLLQTLFLDMIPPAEAESVLRAHITQIEERREQWAAHRARLAAADTPLIRERLQRRDPAEHARIVNLKTHVFDYLIDSATHRIAWAEEAISILS
ncbi:PadR family transcriptional regulator [Mycetocola miduiensis]|uniref:Transcriptional regulator, PadR family n=1 Tax=Mycetocola miduiensis TaxID=995034 RepID=A0A1I5ACT8_9MICO|nr:PadR family transcriptional regulator [Mycetocola miduiensis]SFN60284.1 transcriptional regulator, PadR family [Mycetocola miduiensis]